MFRLLINQSPDGETILEIWNDENHKKITAYFALNEVEVITIDRHGSTASQVIKEAADWLFYWDYLLH